MDIAEATHDKCSVVSYLKRARVTTFCRTGTALALGCVGSGCGGTSLNADTDPASSSATGLDDAKTTSTADPAPGTDDSTTGPGSSSGSASSLGESAASSSGGASSSGDSSGTTGGTDCTKTVVLMGYWPPSNEMLRPFSTDPEQNPDGWVGENWRGLGFDVYAFFPEFPPDGDPTNDPIGSPGSVGADGSDLQVDYQDTSADFWSILDAYQPHIVITHSRGGAIGWELESIEGGHGNAGPDPALDWISDGYGADTRPTQATVDPRSWAAMNTYRNRHASSLLPLDTVQAAAAALGLTTVEIDAGTSGNYLSGFLGLHGIVYAQTTPHAVAGGHIHVGTSVSVDDARALTDASLEAVLETYPAKSLSCPESR